MEADKILSSDTEKVGCEVWKPIKGYEGKYEISNYGNVRNAKNLILTPMDNGNGYMVVGLKNKGSRKNFYIHRLVACAFIPNEENLPEVNHKDYNPKNNHISNLEWITRKGNVQYSAEHRKKPRRCNRSSTGESYICKRGNKFRVTIWHKFDRQFHSLEEAILARDKILKELNYE